MTAAVARIVGAAIPTGVLPDVASWWAMHRRLSEEHEDPADLAVAAGFTADRPAWAFASGYQAALRRLAPRFADQKLALAVTEAGGNHPRAIRTTLEETEGGVRLDGEKSFITLGPHAELVFVAATRGLGDDGRPRLCVVAVPTETPGLTLVDLPPAPFVPEVPHARASFEGAVLPNDAVLEGDGYADFVKPFRTIEDAHVAVAIGAHLLRCARCAGAEAAVVSELVLIVDEAASACRRDPADPLGHLLLGGIFAQLRRMAADPRLWDAADPELRARWTRDRAILDVAERARKARLEKALLTLRR